MGSLSKCETSRDGSVQPWGAGRRYEAVLRLSEALSQCREPEELTEILSEQLGEFLEFLQFYIIVYKENSAEVEWLVMGREKNLVVAGYVDMPVEQRPSWQAYATQEPFHIHDWNSDERIPARLKQGIAALGLDVGPLVFVPLTTPHRRLGALGMSGPPGTAYTSDDIGFLRLIGRVVAFAIDDNFNLRQAEAARAELERQNEKLQRSERELRDVIETIPSMAWSAGADGAAEFFNRRWLDYAGLTADQAQGWGWISAVHPDDLNGLVEYWQGMLASGKSGEVEARLRRFDGIHRWFFFRATPAFDDSGKVVKWYGTNTDIELRKKAEQILAVQNTRLQLLLKLTSQITSNLEFREVLRAISASIRELMHCDLVHVSLPDAASGKYRVHALDFPESKGFVKEELLITPTGVAKRALENLQPTIRSTTNREDFPPDYYDLLVAEGVKTQCVIPLVNQGRAVGALAVARTTQNPFTPEEVNFLGEASGQIAIAIENCLAYREVSELKERLAQEKLYLEQEIRGNMDFGQIVGNSPALKGVLQLVETVAASDSTVLVLGETGTGKELIARAIHDSSRRKDRTFVKVNCAAIPTGLLESELFGHEKGAFTGAIIQKIGRLELADLGTLFLDEVGDIPLEIQPKLLRALQEREFERLGSTRTRKVNVRLIAATNRDLEKMVAAHEFRSDLYYRLNVFPIKIPPLRERKEDIPLLVSYFVEKFAKQMQKKIDSIPTAVMKGLKTWEWPGNIRELENLVERAVILTRGRSLEAPLSELRKMKVDDGERVPADREDIARIVKETIKALHANGAEADLDMKKQRDAIVRALTVSMGRVGGADGAAARMGLNRTTLLARMKKLGIDSRDYA
jgi:formate hydrogenlyase transcriptional activator